MNTLHPKTFRQENHTPSPYPFRANGSLWRVATSTERPKSAHIGFVSLRPALGSPLPVEPRRRQLSDDEFSRKAQAPRRMGKSGNGRSHVIGVCLLANTGNDFVAPELKMVIGSFLYSKNDIFNQFYPVRTKGSENLMLVSFSVANILSFSDTQNLSMLASDSKKDDINQQNTQIASENSERLLKSSLLFGANASGKSNLIKAISLMKEIVLKSVANIENSIAKKVTPFLLHNPEVDSPSEMEVIFYSKGIKYRYGLSLWNGEVAEEWLFYTPQTRETVLFQRENMQIEFNKSSFSEASLFVKNKNIEKTRPDVPFISVLAGFDGEHSKVVTDFFIRLHVLNGISDLQYKNFTTRQLKNNSDFRTWLLKILSSFQISDVKVVESSTKLPFNELEIENDGVRKLVSNIKELTKDKKLINNDLFVIKEVGDNSVEFPLEFESDGTKKLIYILGPIYDAMMNGEILFIDELDSKFHSLLTKLIFKIYHSESNNGSQIIAAVQDVNLMDTEVFRRDQIWFVNKNSDGASELYSLIEYKEKSRALKRSYGDNYLEGAFGAIPLFNNFVEIDNLMGRDDA
ncbi:AAA family ATPase [Pseudomonas fluorescens]|nr:ATP-binding protein [Pseudomonas fluorescens]